MTVVLNKKRDRITPNAIYVGRPTKWGNPFIVGTHGERGKCAEMYHNHLWNSVELLASLHELVGHDLVCFCKPAACHADHLLAAAKWADRHPEEVADRIAQLTQ